MVFLYFLMFLIGQSHASSLDVACCCKHASIIYAGFTKNEKDRKKEVPQKMKRLKKGDSQKMKAPIIIRITQKVKRTPRLKTTPKSKTTQK